MRRLKVIALIGLLGAVAPPLLRAQTTESYTFTTNRLVPDGKAAGLTDVRSLSSAIGTIGSVKVRLKIDGEFNGDLYGFMRHIQNGVTNFCVLLNRPGKASTNSAGYADTGFNITLQDGASNGDLHFYRYVMIPASPLTGTWQPDGRTNDPAGVSETSARASSLANFIGANAAGEWTLFLADLESGGTNMLREWGIDLTGGAYPSIAWSNPADIVYGTSLSSSQLNAAATYNSTNVPGAFTYSPPLGTLLNASNGQPLTVTFTPNDTASFLSVTSSVVINVQPAPATVVADAKSKTYGDANPSPTAVVTGQVAGGSTINYTLATTATQLSNVGGYPITVTFGSNPNYSVTKTESTLTINAKAATVVADAQTKTYGDANPVLTAVVTGQVAGGSTINYSVATTATQLSDAGGYPITVTLGSNPNYSVTKTESTLTINAKAATVVADAQTKTYGDANPSLSAVVTGQVTGGSTINYSVATTATQLSGVGGYPITVTLGSNPNYSVIKTDSTLTVTARALTITANNRSKTYGETITFAGTEFTSGTLVNGDTVTGVTLASAGAAASADVGSYTIVPSAAVGTGIGNYAVNYVNGTLTVGKANTAGTLASSANPALPGANVTFTMNLTPVAPGGGTPSGSVTFRIDGSSAGSGTLSGGSATFSSSTLTHGSHSVVAEYAGSQNHIGTTNTLAPAQIINTPPVANGLTIERYATQSVKVRLSSILTNALDADSDALTNAISAVSAHGGTTTISGDWVTYTPAPGDTNSDSFTFTVGDGFGGTAIGTVTVAIKVDNEPGENLTITDLGNGTVRIIGSGIPGRTYRMQYTDSLITPNWQNLSGGTVTADGNGVFVFNDTSGAPARYYRSAYP